MTGEYCTESNDYYDEMERKILASNPVDMEEAMFEVHLGRYILRYKRKAQADGRLAINTGYENS